MRRVLWVLLALSACGAPGDVGVVRLGLAPSPNAHARVLYIAFDGATLTDGADDATTNVSSLVSGATAIPAFDSTVAAPRISATDVHDVVLDRIRSLLAPYALPVTDVRPASGAYTMVVLGGSHGQLGRSAGVAGLAPIDCADTDASDVAFVFAGDIDAVHGGVVAVGNTAAHEAGHTFGLEHVGEVADLMFAADPAVKSPTLPGLFLQTFTDVADYSSYVAGGAPQVEQCGRADPLDNDAILVAALGAATPGSDVTPPTLTWVTPADGVVDVSTTQALEVDASDASGVTRVELYRNLELWSVLRTAPYTAVVDGEGGIGYYLTAVAVDGAGQRQTSSRWVVPALPPDFAVADEAEPVDAAAAPIDASDHIGPQPGCACALDYGHGAQPSWWLLGLLALGLWNHRRQRRVGNRRG